MDKLQLGNNGNRPPHRAASKARGLLGPNIVGMIADMENLPTDYRLSAEQCRRRADAAVDEVSKASWLRFAEERTKLSLISLTCRLESVAVAPSGTSNLQRKGF
jgi:hypothetical protein